jgi:hypothetical protein
MSSPAPADPIRPQGHRTIEAVLDPAECVELANLLESRPHSRAGARHLMSEPRIAALARDPRLLAIASDGLDREVVPFRATLFAKSRGSNWLIVWHQDTALPFRDRFEAPGWGPWSLKSGIAYTHAPASALSRVIALRVHLDPSTEENGALSVVPGSHDLGVLTDGEISSLVHLRGSRRCVVPMGGVLAMRPLLVHSSSKSVSDTPRRVIHIEYADSLSLGAGRELAVC